jgi:WD40 repeat protein
MSTHAHPGPVWTIAFSPDGETFASGGDDLEVKLWRIREGRCVMTLPGHSTVVWALVFSPDGKRLASGGAERVIRLWDVEPTSNHGIPIALMRSVHWIWSLAFSPDGTRLASGHTTGAIEIWEIESNQLLRTMQHNHRPIGALRFDREGETLYTSSNHHILKQWDLGNGNCLKTVAEDAHDSWIKAVALGEDGELVVTGSDDHSVQVWQVGRANKSHTVTRFSGCEAQVWAVALSQDGRMIAGSDDHGMTVLWDTASGTVLKRLSCDRPYERMNIHGITGFNDAQRATLIALGAIATQEPEIRQPISAMSGPTLVLLEADEGSDSRAKRIP